MCDDARAHAVFGRAHRMILEQGGPDHASESHGGQGEAEKIDQRGNVLRAASTA